MRNAINQSIKYLMKLLVIIVLPITLIALSYTYIFSSVFNESRLPILVFIAISLLVVSIVFNVLLYIKTKASGRLTPDITFEYMPVIGLAFGYENKMNCHMFAIIIPFCVIEINVNSKSKKEKEL